MNRRWLTLFAAFVGVVLLRVVDPLAPKPLPGVVNVTRAAQLPSGVASAPATSVQDNETRSWPVRRRIESEPVDIFAAAAPPAPPPAPAALPTITLAPAPPPPPATPALPFTVVGSWTEDGKTQVFLAGPQGTVIAHAGDTLSGSYHIDSVGATALQITYLPLHQIQSLTWSASR